MERHRSNAFASVLICATALMFVALLGHPAPGSGHAHSAQALLERVYAARGQLGVMHGAVLGIQLVVLTCVLAFCRSAGFEHPFVAFAAVSFCAGTAAVCVAGSLDGFLIPAFAQPHLTLGGEPLDMRAMIAGGAIVIQYATKAGIALIAISVLLLSLQAGTRWSSRTVAASGVALAFLQIVALFAIPLLTPHTVAFAALPALIWQLMLGAAWLREA